MNWSSSVTATTLKASAGFTRVSAALVVTGYAHAFYLLSLSLRSIPLVSRTRWGPAWGARSSWPECWS
jgi:hypothetical protein